MKRVLNKAFSTTLRAVLLSSFTVFSSYAVDNNKIVEDCANCHGKDGVSTEPDVPIIAGYSETYIVDSMLVYKDKGRPCPETEYINGKNKGSKTSMCKIAQGLSDQEIEGIAKFYASKPFVRAKQTVDSTKAEIGKKIHKRHCKKCHEDGGSSADDDAGILAGQWMPYLKTTFKDYASGNRDQPKKMKKKMEKLSESDVEALIHYYGSFK